MDAESNRGKISAPHRHLRTPHWRSIKLDHKQAIPWKDIGLQGDDRRPWQKTWSHRKVKLRFRKSHMASSVSETFHLEQRRY